MACPKTSVHAKAASLSGHSTLRLESARNSLSEGAKETATGAERLLPA